MQVYLRWGQGIYTNRKSSTFKVSSEGSLYLPLSKARARGDSVSDDGGFSQVSRQQDAKALWEESSVKSELKYKDERSNLYEEGGG